LETATTISLVSPVPWPCFPIDLKSYDVSALRTVCDAFSEVMQRIPAFNKLLLSTGEIFYPSSTGSAGT
jgi:hypothetical protein